MSDVFKVTSSIVDLMFEFQYFTRYSQQKIAAPTKQSLKLEGVMNVLIRIRLLMNM